MFENQSKLFTIGQFAKIHGVTKKTLMWYDEVDLMKPSLIGENGYRYYSYQQSSALETILMLRELDVSIEEIKRFMQNRSAAGMEQLLHEKIDELEERINYLKSMKKTLVSRRQDMKDLMYLDLSEISIVEREKSYLAVVSIEQEVPTLKDVESVISIVKQHKVPRLHDAIYGSMIAVENIYQKKYDDYSAIYIELPHYTSKKGLHKRPGGRYLRAFCKGPWDNLRSRYEEILAYVKKEGLTLYGYSYETGINESVLNSFDEYITQIELPIKDDQILTQAACSSALKTLTHN